jgi:predicted nucleic acid-binding protein
VILCDTGPLVALIDADDPYHAICLRAMDQLVAEALLTTWPCLAEAMHLLYRAGGIQAQDALWDLTANALMTLHAPAPNEWERLRSLMQEYADSPMDLADASLVAAAEASGLRLVFTLDTHFRGYRANGTEPFHIVP